MKSKIEMGIRRGCILSAFAMVFLAACFISSASLVFGCAAVPSEDAERILEKIEKELGKHSSSDAGAKKSSADTTADGGQSASAPASGALVYRYGGFHGENAVEDPNTQIKDLHITRSKLTYKWANGSLKNWGLADTDASALACFFFWDGKQWVGGKGDWISTSRTSRDFNNINGGYNGWKPDLYWSAPKRAFCIVSKDGKKRTNLLETKEP